MKTFLSIIFLSVLTYPFVRSNTSLQNDLSYLDYSDDLAADNSLSSVEPNNKILTNSDDDALTNTIELDTPYGAEFQHHQNEAPELTYEENAEINTVQSKSVQQTRNDENSPVDQQEKTPSFIKRMLNKLKSMFTWGKNKDQKKDTCVPQNDGTLAPGCQPQTDLDFIGTVYSHSLKDFQTVKQQNGAMTSQQTPITTNRMAAHNYGYYPYGKKHYKRVRKYFKNTKYPYGVPQYYMPVHYSHSYANLPHTSQYGFYDSFGNWHWYSVTQIQHTAGIHFPFLNAQNKEKQVDHWVKKFMRGTRKDFLRNGILSPSDSIEDATEEDIIEVPIYIPIYSTHPSQQDDQSDPLSENQNANQTPSTQQSNDASTGANDDTEASTGDDLSQQPQQSEDSNDNMSSTGFPDEPQGQATAAPVIPVIPPVPVTTNDSSTGMAVSTISTSQQEQQEQDVVTPIAGQKSQDVQEAPDAAANHRAN